MKQFTRFALFMLIFEFVSAAISGKSLQEGAAYYFGYWIIAPVGMGAIWAGYSAICDVVSRKFSKPLELRS